MTNIKNIATISNLDLKPYNTLKISSTAKVVYFPQNEDEILSILNNEKNAIIIGNGSNIIFGSNGVNTPLISLSKMDRITLDKTLYVESGTKSPKLSRYAQENSIEGFEFLIGIPSSIGGNIFMNAGASNQTISDNITSIRVIDKTNLKILNLKKEECNFEYRSSLFKNNPNKYIILGAEFEIKKTDKNIIDKRIKENLEKRKKTQPMLNLPNAGSTFKNPKNNSAGRLIDECGLRGTCIGGAKIYENHANFIINYNNATSEDILKLMSKMQDCVYNKFGIKLESEIIFIGEKNQTEEELWKKITTQQ